MMNDIAVLKAELNKTKFELQDMKTRAVVAEHNAEYYKSLSEEAIDLSERCLQLAREIHNG